MSLNIRDEFQKFLKSNVVGDISKTLNSYEKKAKQLVGKFNLKSQQTRAKSKKQLEQFSKQLQRTRNEVEKTVRKLLDSEAKILTQGYSELIAQIKSLAEAETKTKTKSSKTKAAKPKAAAAPKKKASSKAKSTPKKKATIISKQERPSETDSSLVNPVKDGSEAPLGEALGSMQPN